MPSKHYNQFPPVKPVTDSWPRPPIPRDPVTVVEEFTGYRTTSGQVFASMDEACDAQEAEDFRQWCDDNIVGGEWSAEMFAREVLKVWKVRPRDTK